MFCYERKHFLVYFNVKVYIKNTFQRSAIFLLLAITTCSIRVPVFNLIFIHGISGFLSEKNIQPGLRRWALVVFITMPGCNTFRFSIIQYTYTHTPYIATYSAGKRSFHYAAATVWNSLPNSIRNTPTLAAFTRQLKTNIFRQAFPTQSCFCFWYCL